jgi:RNA polymerase sigma-70 factor, ECF subfamily
MQCDRMCSQVPPQNGAKAPELDEDVATMLRLQNGDDLALNELMSRWQTPLIAFTLRYTGNSADAVDLAQESFVRVYESRDRYQPTAKFSTWLFAIASNLCRNLARWRERHPTVPLSTPGDDGEPALARTLAAHDGTPADNAERNDLANAVREHIQNLPHDLKTVILLFQYHELGYEEIAATLGCTPKAVETRLYRARQHLRESLTRWKL